jgi:propanediol dehydratase large subunit
MRFRFALAIALGLVACGKAADDSKRMQESAPPKQVEPPTDLSIAVAIDGSAAPPIIADTLRATKPDFADSDRRAWKIGTLVAAAAPTGTTIEATSPTGTSVKFVHPTSDGLEPVLYLTRRGEIIVSAVDPRDPFPEFHGRGNRLHRAGDQTPHVAPVAKLAITHPTPAN